MANITDFGNRLDRSDLIIGIHDRHQTGIRPDRFRYLFRFYDPVPSNIKQSDLKAFVFQRFECMQNRMVFKCCGDDVFFTVPAP